MNREARYWLLTLLSGAAFVATLWCMFTNSAGFMWCGLLSLCLLGGREWDKRQGVLEDRTACMRENAERMGFSFRESTALNVLGWSETFTLTRDDFKLADASLGKHLDSWLRPRARNVMEKTVGDTTIVVFDYQPTMDCDTRPEYIVFAAKSPRLEYGYSAITTATSWQRLSDRFRSEPSVHEGFHHEGAANMLPAVTDQLDDQTSVECGDGFLLVYRANSDRQPNTPEDILRTGSVILATLCDSDVPAACSS